MQRRETALHKACGYNVEVSGFQIHLADKFVSHQVRQPYSIGIAVRALGNVQQHNALDKGRLRLRLALHPEAADDGCIDPRAAVVLAHLFNHQDVEFVGGQQRHQLDGCCQQLRLFLDELAGFHANDVCGLLEAVFDNRQPAQDRRLLDQNCSDLTQTRRQLPDAQTMKLLRSARPAESDHAHLGETALHVSHQGGVALYAVEHNHAVHIEHMAIDIGGQSLRGLAHLDGFRADQHGRSHGVRCHPQAVQDFPLSLGGTAAVASHGGNQAGLKPVFLQIIDRDPGHLNDFVDPPAAGGNGNLGALGQPFFDAEFFQLLIDGALDGFHARTSKCLLGEIKLGKHDFTL